MRELNRQQAELLGIEWRPNPAVTGEITVSCPVIENALERVSDWCNQKIGSWQLDWNIEGKPPTPSASQLKAGWNKLEGDRWIRKEPAPGGYVFDTETFGSYRQYPMIGVLAGNDNEWYLWISPWVFGREFRPELIVFPDGPFTLIAHNAAFDVARVANSYISPGQIRWLCTQSMAQVCRGISPTILNSFRGNRPSWVRESCRVSLLECVRLWVGSQVITEEDKALRNFFAEATPSDPTLRDRLLENWDRLLGYAINDVYATALLFDKLWEEYLDYSPSPVSVWALSYLHSARMPISREFEEWKRYCDAQFGRIQAEIESIISRLAEDAIATGLDTDHPSYAWYRHLDWHIYKKGKNAGRPKWADKITLRSRSLPYLLRLTWNGYPIQHSMEEGWHYLSDGEVIRLPHKDGEDCKVGNPLADTFRSYIEDGVLASAIDGFDLPEFHTLYFNTTYWIGARKRIDEVAPYAGYVTQGDTVHRTLTRRAGGSLWSTVPDLKEGKIGTAIKAQIRVNRDGYRLVGADFSTQETAIAALYQDAYLRIGVGGSPYSLTQWVGKKEDKTDSHSLLAGQFGIPRQAAKRANFAAQYGCGVNKIAEVLRVETGRPREELRTVAREILSAKRGSKNPYGKWEGGSESGYLNYVISLLSKSRPRTPLLAVSCPNWFEFAKVSFWTTLANWPVQSVGVDILHLFLAITTWQIEEQGLQGITLAVTRHDEVWFECPEGLVDDLAEIMQAAHLATWATLVKRLQLSTLPESLCLFPEINVDKVLRKEVDLPVWDGFGTVPEDGYVLPDSLWK